MGACQPFFTPSERSVISFGDRPYQSANQFLHKTLNAYAGFFDKQEAMQGVVKYNRFLASLSLRYEKQVRSLFEFRKWAGDSDRAFKDASAVSIYVEVDEDSIEQRQSIGLKSSRTSRPFILILLLLHTLPMCWGTAQRINRNWHPCCEYALPGLFFWLCVCFSGFIFRNGWESWPQPPAAGEYN